jgi:hypothetical protein
MASLLLASEEGGSAYFDRLLSQGISACPSWMGKQYPGLKDWRGISVLKSDLRTLFGVETELPVLLANRSIVLMEFAARLFFPQCRNVLTCDLGWPAYHAILEEVAVRTAGSVTTVSLRDKILTDRATVEEIVQIITHEYVVNRCDGLFLPAISNLGVRFPVERIVNELKGIELRFVGIDGAQEFCHMEPQASTEYCDIYLAGCHKWLAGYHPMGVATYGHRRSRDYVNGMLRNLLNAGKLDDPLLRLTDQIEAGTTTKYYETVNLSALFTCQAAVAEISKSQRVSESVHIRYKNRKLVADIVNNSEWETKHLQTDMESGILLAQAKSYSMRKTDPLIIRNSFREAGIGLTSYENGYLRLSMPNTPLPTDELSKLQSAFYAVSAEL